MSLFSKKNLVSLTALMSITAVSAAKKSKKSNRSKKVMAIRQGDITAEMMVSLGITDVNKERKEHNIFTVEELEEFNHQDTDFDMHVEEKEFSKLDRIALMDKPAPEPQIEEYDTHGEDTNSTEMNDSNEFDDAEEGEESEAVDSESTDLESEGTDTDSNDRNLQSSGSSMNPRYEPNWFFVDRWIHNWELDHSHSNKNHQIRDDNDIRDIHNNKLNDLTESYAPVWMKSLHVLIRASTDFMHQVADTNSLPNYPYTYGQMSEMSEFVMRFEVETSKNEGSKQASCSFDNELTDITSEEACRLAAFNLNGNKKATRFYKYNFSFLAKGCSYYQSPWSGVRTYYYNTHYRGGVSRRARREVVCLKKSVLRAAAHATGSVKAVTKVTETVYQKSQSRKRRCSDMGRDWKQITNAEECKTAANKLSTASNNVMGGSIPTPYTWGYPGGCVANGVNYYYNRNLRNTRPNSIITLVCKKTTTSNKEVVVAHRGRGMDLLRALQTDPAGPSQWHSTWNDDGTFQNFNTQNFPTWNQVVSAAGAVSSVLPQQCQTGGPRPGQWRFKSTSMMGMGSSNPTGIARPKRNPLFPGLLPGVVSITNAQDSHIPPSLERCDFINMELSSEIFRCPTESMLYNVINALECKDASEFLYNYRPRRIHFIYDHDAPRGCVHKVSDDTVYFNSAPFSTIPESGKPKDGNYELICRNFHGRRALTEEATLTEESDELKESNTDTNSEVESELELQLEVSAEKPKTSNLRGSNGK